MKKLALALAAVISSVISFATDIGTADAFVAAMNNDPTGSYTLKADIDLTDSGYTTISSFSGTLDGAGHTLSGIGAQPLFAHLAGTVRNLTLDGTGVAKSSWPQATTDILGVIATYAGDATFESCRLESYSIPTPYRSIGGFFVGIASNNVSFTGCSIASTCASTGANNSFQGGFIGKLQARANTGVVCSFSACTNSAAMTKGGDYNSSFGCGGFIGNCIIGSANPVTASVTFTRCVNNGACTAGSHGHFGGFIALATVGPKDPYAAGYGKLVFTDCENQSDVSPVNPASNNDGYRAGFVSQCGSGVVVEMTGCVNRGDINAGGEKYVAGFVACFSANIDEVVPSVFRDCANYGSITGRVNAAGFVTTAGSGRTVLNPAIKFVNCGNYGAVTAGTAAGVFFAELQSNVKVACDNCFTLTDTYCGSIATPANFTTANMWTPSTPGYTAQGACASLSAVAKEKKCNALWKVGRASGFPELIKWSGDVYVIHTVRYLDYDGTVLNEEEVEHGNAPSPVDTPERVGYVFTGWSPSVPAIITDDVEATATYRVRESGEIGCRADFVTDLTANPAGSFRLACDINLADSGYTTLAEFSGVLDGQGHVLTGLGALSLFKTLTGTVRDLTIDGRVKGDNTILSLGSVSWAVLCVTAKGATVEDVKVAGYTISGGQTAIGFLAAEATTSSTTGCVFSRSTTDATCSLTGNTINSRMQCGGIVGKVSRDTDFIGECALFVDCTNRATISCKASDQYGYSGVAGICGYVGVNRGVGDGQLPYVRFVRCANHGTVTAGRYAAFAGVVGRVDGPNYHNKETLKRGSFVALTDCSNDAAISFSGDTTGGVLYAGGLVGGVRETGSLYLTNCVNRANVTATCGGASIICGGLVGYFSTSGLLNEVVNCANYGNVSGSVIGGLSGKIEANTGWNVGNVSWLNCANYGTLTTVGELDVYGGEVIGFILSGNASLNKYIVDNCFVSGETLCASSIVFTVTNVKSTTDSGYRPVAARNALNAVATEKEYGSWILGHDKSVIRPEIASLCTKPYLGGLIMFVR